MSATTRRQGFDKPRDMQVQFGAAADRPQRGIWQSETSANFRSWLVSVAGPTRALPDLRPHSRFHSKVKLNYMSGTGSKHYDFFGALRGQCNVPAALAGDLTAVFALGASARPCARLGRRRRPRARPRSGDARRDASAARRPEPIDMGGPRDRALLLPTSSKATHPRLTELRLPGAAPAATEHSTRCSPSSRAYSPPDLPPRARSERAIGRRRVRVSSRSATSTATRRAKQAPRQPCSWRVPRVRRAGDAFASLRSRGAGPKARSGRSARRVVSRAGCSCCGEKRSQGRTWP